MRGTRRILHIVCAEFLVAPELPFRNRHVCLREHGIRDHEHASARLRGERQSLFAAKAVECSVVALGDQFHARPAEIGKDILGVLCDAIARHQRKIRPEIVAAPPRKFLQHVVRPVLRTGLVAVHDNAGERNPFRF